MPKEARFCSLQNRGWGINQQDVYLLVDSGAHVHYAGCADIISEVFMSRRKEREPKGLIVVLYKASDLVISSSTPGYTR